MEIQFDILETLRCSECKNYLSRIPVMVKANGDSVCGRCDIAPEEKHLATRMKAYERLAAMMSFPCCYKSEGCMVNLQMNDLEQHEMYCEFHKLKCPLLPSGSCSWVGPRNNLLTHYRKNHSQLVLEHPSSLNPNIKRNCEMNMLVSVSDHLFLVQVKCNITTAKLWHCVRHIGNPEFAKYCEYNFEIHSSKGNFSKKCQVIAEENFQIYEDSSNEIDLNGMLILLGCFEDLKFSVRIDCCLFTVRKGVLQETLSEIFCSNKSNGCMYKDNSISNVSKHEFWFCTNHTVCPICSSTVQGLYDHYLNKHMTMIYKHTLERWDLRTNCEYMCALYIDTAVFLCVWNFTNSYLHFIVTSDLRKTDNKQFELRLTVINPLSEHCEAKTLQLDHSNTKYDWIGLFENDINQPIINKEYHIKNIVYCYGIELIVSKNKI